MAIRISSIRAQVEKVFRVRTVFPDSRAVVPTQREILEHGFTTRSICTAWEPVDGVKIFIGREKYDEHEPKVLIYLPRLNNTVLVGVCSVLAGKYCRVDIKTGARFYCLQPAYVENSSANELMDALNIVFSRISFVVLAAK